MLADFHSVVTFPGGCIRLEKNQKNPNIWSFQRKSTFQVPRCFWHLGEPKTKVTAWVTLPTSVQSRRNVLNTGVLQLFPCKDNYFLTSD